MYVTRRRFLALASSSLVLSLAACTAPAAAPAPAAPTSAPAPVATAAPPPAAATAAPAAAATAAPAAPKTIKADLQAIMMGATPARRAGWDAAYALFQKKFPDVSVTVDWQGWTEGKQKLLTQIAAGNPPDVALNQGGWTLEFAAMGALEPLASRVNAWEGKPQIVKSFWDVMSWQGDIWGMPIYSAIYPVLYYNKDHLKEVGMPDGPKDYQEMLTAAQKLTGGGRFGFGLAIKGNVHDSKIVMMSWDKSAEFVKVVDGKRKAAMMTDKTVPGLEWYRDLATKHKVVQTSYMADDSGIIRDHFQNGRVSMFYGSMFDRTEFKKAGKPNYGIRSVPAGPEREYWWLSPYDSLLFKGSKNKDAAWELLKHMALGEGHYANAKEVGMFPLDTKLSDRFTDPEEQYMLKALERSSAQPFMPEFGPSEAVHASFVEKMFLGQISAKDLLTQEEDIVNKEIAKIYKS